MEEKDREFLKRLFKAFKTESEERIRTLTNGILEWEAKQETPEMEKIVEGIYRDVHSLKGASRAVNLHELEEVFIKLEEYFAKYRKKEIQFSKDSFTSLHKILQLVEGYLLTVDPGESTLFPPDMLLEMTSLKETITDTVLSANKNNQSFSEVVIKRPNENESKKSPMLPSKLEAIDPEVTEQQKIRISRHGLDLLLLQTEEFILTRNDFDLWLTELDQIKSLSDLVLLENQQIRDGSLENALLSNMEILHQKIDSIQQKIKKHYHQYQIDLEKMRTMVQDILLVPFREISEFFPKNIRDLAVDLKKEVSYMEFGSDILIDRRILEVLREPFLHLIRNSIDHGIESPSRRKQLGKSLMGRITIHIQKVKGQMIEILFEDDGAGFDFDTIRKKLQQKPGRSDRIIDNMPESDLLELMLEEGISSKESVSNISGRGLGLTIIRNKIESLGGNLSIESRKDKGTVFSFRLPTELTSYRGLLFSVGDRTFAVPSSQLEKVIRLPREELHWIDSHYAFSYHNQMLSVYSLREILEIKSAPSLPDRKDVFLLLLGDKEILAYLVDDVFLEQDLLARPLDPLSAQTPLLSGVAVIRSDLTVPILNVGEILLRTNHRHNISPTDAIFQEKILEKKTIMVVEDSITSRMILKNILETEGYSVVTAIDGFEATLLLKREKVDLVVSDIEMPRMNGFDLTKIIRSTEDLSDMPVVLVTTLDSKEDREKGLNCGADAYIVKSNFDQSNLIDVVRRLLE